MNSLPVSTDDFVTAKSHFEAFATNFLNESLASRWIALFANAKESSWKKINPWDLWEESKRKSGPLFMEVSVPVQLIKTDTEICPFPDDDAVVICFGHSRPKVLIKRFVDISVDDWPLDGLISLERGKRVFVINHDGEILFCKSGKLISSVVNRKM